MNAKRGSKVPVVQWSSGNVFADLGLTDAETLQAKASLVVRLHAEIRRRKLSQRQAAKVLGIDQPKVSALFSGKFSGFSTDRLLRFLTAMGQDVEIIVRPKAKRRTAGRIHVSAA